jgi:flavin-dependent dehydrogenase
MISKQPDVVVIGAGPSGCTVATLLAQQGFSVQMLERDRFPRFHVGESLIPHTYDVLERLGLLDRMRASGFVKKHSVQFVSEQGRLSEPFYFSDYDPHARSQTWQVLRSEFDTLMMENARQHGVEVHEGTRVLEVLMEGERAVGVRVQGEQGPAREIHCQVVVDAAGQSGLIIDRLGLRQWDPDLKKAAIWTYWRGAKRETGKDEGSTIVMQTAGKKGWFWYIPLAGDLVSVGVVADHDYLFRNRASKDPTTIYFEEVDRCPGLIPRLEGATQCEPMRTQKEYSYRASQAAGDGWVLVGDAFGFLDPLYSSGILLALQSGALAADAIGDALRAGDPSESRLRCWEADYIRGVDRMRRLVQAFYAGLNFGKLVRRHPEKKGLITDILIGRLFHDELDQLWPLIDALQEEEHQKEAMASG